MLSGSKGSFRWMLSSRGNQDFRYLGKSNSSRPAQHCKELPTGGPWHQHRSRSAPPTSITAEHGTARESPGLAGSRQPSSELCLGYAHPLHSSWLFFRFFCSPTGQFFPFLPFLTNLPEVPAVALLSVGNRTHAEPSAVCS